MIDSYVCVDIETTGLSEDTNSIVEIGAVKVVKGKQTDVFEYLINPKRKMPCSAMMVTGITDDMLKGKPDIGEVMPKFVEFCQGYPLLGHNVSFDYGFLKTNAARLKLDWSANCMDTLKIAKKYLPELPSRKLEYLCEYFEILDEHHHRAMNDARITISLYNILVKKFYQEGSSVFAPASVEVKVKKQESITWKQKKFLNDLLERQGIHPNFLLDEMTKSEASYAIDMILSGRGNQL